MSTEKMTLEEATEKGLTSMDVAVEKREALRQLFPEVFTEEKIDFDQLRRVMGDWVEADKERFGLNWPGKADCMKVIQAPSVATLKPEPKASVDFDDTENVFIEGDNLEVLKLLQKSYFRKIKMIYIDPPYNTGKEFIYPDKYQENLDTYLAYTGQIDAEGKKFSTNTDAGGRFHANWLNMMYPRLYLARNLLRDDGVIFVSIDDNEQANLRALMDLIFGQENFLGCISVVSNLKGRSDDKYFATAHNYLLAYSRGGFETNGVPLPEEYLDDYSETDAEGRRYRLQGLRKRGSQSKREDRPKMFYPFYVDPSSKKVQLEPSDQYTEEVYPKLSDGSDGRWRWGKETALSRLDELMGVTVGSEKRWDVAQIDYADGGGEGKRIKPKSVWMGSEFANEAGTLEVKRLFEGVNLFDNPKPIGLIKYCLEQAVDDDDIVLDFFAGSSSTAHAVIDFNVQNSKSARYIMVQLPEKIDESSPAFKKGFKTISELSIERIRRLTEVSPSDELDLAGLEDFDRGFRVFSLAKSNFSIWDGTADEGADQISKQLEMHVEHLDKASSPEDILYELLLKSGFEITTEVKKCEMAGKTVYSVADGVLLICLDKAITPELIDELAKADPLQVICLDEGFKGNDQLKTNAVQTFKSLAKEDEEAVVFRTV